MTLFKRLLELSAIIFAVVILLHYAPDAKAETKAADVLSVPTNISLPVKRAIVIELPPAFDGRTAQFFHDLGAYLNSPDSADIITFKFYGYGGDALLGNDFINNMEDAKERGKIINMRITGPAYSMHAFITCFANEVTLDDGASLMFHGMASEDSWMWGLIPVRNATLDPASQAAQHYILQVCKKVGRLTDQDIDVILSGGEVYISRNGDKIETSYKSHGREVGEAVRIVCQIALLLSLVLLFIAIVKRI